MDSLFHADISVCVMSGMPELTSRCLAHTSSIHNSSDTKDQTGVTTTSDIHNGIYITSAPGAD